MKKLSRIHLMNMEKKKLSPKQMKNVLGGMPGVCGCGCCYQGSGGSSEADNGDANINSGYHSYNC